MKTTTCECKIGVNICLPCNLRVLGFFDAHVASC